MSCDGDNCDYKNIQTVQDGFFSVETPEEGVVLIDFTKYEGANIWTSERLEAFLEIVDGLSSNPPEKGIVFMMGNHFGADIKFFKDATKPKFSDFITKINQAFDIVSALPCETVCVSGHCYGGGLELALACKKRIGIDNPKARMGLTETNFGLMPGAGGTQRMPRLIGTKAAPMIIKGESVPMDKALELGLVDKVIAPNDDGYKSARNFMDEEIDRSNLDLSEILAVSAQVISDIEDTGVLEANQLAAINAMVKGSTREIVEGLTIERIQFDTHCVGTDLMRSRIAEFLAKGFEGEGIVNMI